MPLSYIRRAQVFALTAACLVHAGLFFWLFWPVQGNAAPMEQLAVMDFLSYDPNGGEPSSGKGKDPVSPSQDEVKPEPEPVPEPEPEKEIRWLKAFRKKRRKTIPHPRNRRKNQLRANPSRNQRIRLLLRPPLPARQHRVAPAGSLVPAEAAGGAWAAGRV